MLAEREYQRQNGHFGSLAELEFVGTRAIPHELSGGHIEGFSYQIRFSREHFELTTVPDVVGRTGYWGYFANESGTIRSRGDGARPSLTDEVVASVSR